MRYGFSCMSYISTSISKKDKPGHTCTSTMVIKSSNVSVKSDSYMKSDTLSSGVNFGTNLLFRIEATCCCYRLFMSHDSYLEGIDLERREC